MFKLWNFGVLGGEAQGNASIRKFSYLLTDEDTETISDVKADNFFISEKARLLLNDVIEVLDTKDTKKVYHFLRVKEVSLTSVKTEELGFDANAIDWGEISGTITSQEDLIKYIKDREIDNSKSKLEIASHKLNIQLVNEMGTIKYDKNIDVLDTIEQDNHNLIDSHSVWKELIDKINSEFKAEIDTNKLKLKLKLINNNGDLILNKEYEFDIDLTPTENSKNLIDSNGVWEKDVNKDNSYFKLDKTDWKVKLKLVLNDGTEILNEEIDYLQMATYAEIYQRKNIEKYINPAQLDLAVLLWNTDTTYATGKLCYKNGKIYKSKIDNNKGNDPELDTTETNWAEYQNVNIATEIRGKDTAEDVKVGSELAIRKAINDCNMVPSNNYIDLTLGASGTEYTAPANGWVVLDGLQKSGSHNWIVILISSGLRWCGNSYGVSSTVTNSLPLTKGNTFIVFYSNDTSITFFRFVYSTNQ